MYFKKKILKCSRKFYMQHAQAFLRTLYTHKSDRLMSYQNERGTICIYNVLFLGGGQCFIEEITVTRNNPFEFKNTIAKIYFLNPMLMILM